MLCQYCQILVVIYSNFYSNGQLRQLSNIQFIKQEKWVLHFIEKFVISIIVIYLLFRSMEDRKDPLVITVEINIALIRKLNLGNTFKCQTNLVQGRIWLKFV